VHVGILGAHVPGRSVFLVADEQALRFPAIAASVAMSATHDRSAAMRGRRVRLKVCLVEDEDDFRLLLTRTLSRAPAWECVASYAAAEAALEDIPQRKPDLVLMDIKLPGMNGIEC